MKFNKGDFVRINPALYGYGDLRDDIGIVVNSEYVTTTVMFQHHDNPRTADHTYGIVTNNLELVQGTIIPCEGCSIKKSVSTTFSIKDVIFNDPAVIILWNDGTKTVVKCSENDIFDPEKGMAMAIAKKALGNQGNYYETFKKYLPEEEDIDDFGLHPFISLGSLCETVSDSIDATAAQIREWAKDIKKTAFHLDADELRLCASCKHLCQPLGSSVCSGCTVLKENWEPNDMEGESK